MVSFIKGVKKGVKLIYLPKNVRNAGEFAPRARVQEIISASYPIPENVGTKPFISHIRPCPTGATHENGGETGVKIIV